MKRLALLVLFFALACSRGETAQAPPDAERGRRLVTQYGCNVCHVIPGTDGPQGALGPSLEGLASRPTISFGAVQNTPANLAQFIQNPASLNPQTSMPAIGLAGNDAQDITAFLLTLDAGSAEAGSDPGNGT